VKRPIFYENGELIVALMNVACSFWYFD